MTEPPDSQIAKGSLFDLSGKVAVITGSSRGIGRAIAARFVDHGANVVVSSRKLEACRLASAQINEAAGRKASIAIAANVSKRADLEALISGAKSQFGRVDVLVCNAAIHPYVGPSMGTSEDVMRKVLDANLMSHHWLAGLVLPAMVERQFGRIILIASIVGHLGTRTFYSYSISKAAEMQLGRSLAVEYGAHGIRVNVIAPGTISTDMAKPLTENPQAMEAEMRRNTVKRLGEPDEIAGVAVMLASRAGGYINGQVINVDGGYSIAYD